MAVDSADVEIPSAMAARVLPDGRLSQTVPITSIYLLDEPNGGLSAMELEISATGFVTTRVQVPKICGPGTPLRLILRRA